MMMLIIHIYVEMSQENALYSNLKPAKPSFFIFTKLENRRVKQVLPGEVVTHERGEDIGKGCRRVNIVQILCTHECKWKNDTC
jgi:hypothetical protein